MSTKTEIENLQDLIKDSIRGEVVEQTVASLLPPGENYGSVMYKVDFKVKKEDKVEEFHGVAKCTPLNPVTQEIFNTQETFKTEIGWYTTVIPTYKQFQRDHGVENEIDFFQKLYGARISLDPNSTKVDLDAVMLTENLKYLGYQSIDRHVGFDLPTTHSVLKALATFHAVPLAIKIENPELFNKNIKPYLPKFGSLGDKVLDDMKKNVIQIFEQIPAIESIMERLTKSVEEAAIFDPHPVREPWATVTHRDVWINNIMVTQGKEIKTIILDLQTPFIGSPAADLVFFLFTSVKLDVVSKNVDGFIKFYYEEFIRNLKELNISTEEFTFESFLNEIAEEVKAGEFAHAASHSQMILGEKGKTDFDSSDPNFKMENWDNAEVPINEKIIEKFKWMALESDKRKWI